MEPDNKGADIPPPQYGSTPPKTDLTPGQYPPGQYPPPQGYIPPQGAPQAYPPPQGPGYTQTNVVIQQQPTIGTTMRFTQYPTTIICQHCHATVTTTTLYESGTLTWVIAGVMCLLGCWLGCCLIPFCVDEAHDVIHKCPSCRNTIGVFRRLS